MPRIAPKPLPLRLLNRTATIVQSIGLPFVPLRKADLLAKARKKTGLSDFGDSRFEEGLDVLIDSLERESKLSGLGRITAQRTILDLLTTRLQIEDYLKKHPEIFEEKIERPLFIIGPPRTGTTITHYLLSQDERHRFPFVWEAFTLYPPIRPETLTTDPRIADTDKKLEMIHKLAPDHAAAHPLTTWDAQECVLMHSLEFCSAQFLPMYQCHGYQNWVDRQDMRWVYEREKVMLQYMQSGGARKERWLLKSPIHMCRIDDILAVFPDALFIQTHREPTEVVISVASLHMGLQQMVTDSIDFERAGERYLDIIELQMRQNVEQRKRHEDKRAQFFDIQMCDVIRDPVGQVEAAYRHFGIDLPARTKQKMLDYMKAHALDKKARHVYQATDFGIDVQREWSRFQFYRDHYHLPAV